MRQQFCANTSLGDPVPVGRTLLHRLQTLRGCKSRGESCGADSGPAGVRRAISHRHDGEPDYHSDAAPNPGRHARPAPGFAAPAWALGAGTGGLEHARSVLAHAACSSGRPRVHTCSCVVHSRSHDGRRRCTPFPSPLCPSIPAGSMGAQWALSAGTGGLGHARSVLAHAACSSAVATCSHMLMRSPFEVTRWAPPLDKPSPLSPSFPSDAGNTLATPGSLIHEHLDCTAWADAPMAAARAPAGESACVGRAAQHCLRWLAFSPPVIPCRRTNQTACACLVGGRAPTTAPGARRAGLRFPDTGCGVRADGRRARCPLWMLSRWPSQTARAHGGR